MSVDEKAGRYTVRLYINGKWNEVTVDDRIPCGADGLPAFGHNIDKKETWVVILEKACAKLLGSYEALHGGYLEEGVAMLTGGRPERVYINNIDNKPHKGTWQMDKLWEKLVLYNKENTLMGAAISNSKEESDQTKGLVAGHAYGILDVRTTKDNKYRLVKLRNPWASFEWKGAWSDSSRLWNPTYKKELEWSQKDDGVFWMAFEDFSAIYDKITCCRIFNNSIMNLPSDSSIVFKVEKPIFPNASWKAKKIEGEWSHENSGGMGSDLGFAKNPHIKLVVKEPCRVFISILRPFLALEADAQYYRTSIGFVLTKGVQGIDKAPKDNTPNTLTQYPVYGRYNAIETDFEPGEYTITPCTLYSNRRGTFTVEVYSPKNFDLAPIADNIGLTALREGMVSARGDRPDMQTLQPTQNPNLYATFNTFSNTANRPLAGSFTSPQNGFSSLMDDMRDTQNATGNGKYTTTYKHHFSGSQRWK